MGFVGSATKWGLIGFGAVSIPFGISQTIESTNHMQESAGEFVPQKLSDELPEAIDPAIKTANYSASVIRNLGGIVYRLYDPEDVADARSNLQFDFGHNTMLAICGAIALRRGIRM